MGAEIADISNGILTWRVTGELTHAEFTAAQKQAAGIIQRQGKVRFLVLVENFAGTDQAGNWGDISFQAENDPFIEKIAIVGDKKWEDLALLFTGKGIRRVPIEYFSGGDVAKAKAWVAG
jgi:hypothetical protein